MASPAAGADVRTAGEPLTAQPSAGLAPAGSAPAPSPSSSNPVDPGTGESGQAKQNRVDYAPYVIGAVVVVVLDSRVPLLAQPPDFPPLKARLSPGVQATTEVVLRAADNPTESKS